MRLIAAADSREPGFDTAALVGNPVASSSDVISPITCGATLGSQLGPRNGIIFALLSRES
jgi:hypothetical protein